MRIRRLVAALACGALAMSTAPANADDLTVGVHVTISGTVAGMNIEEEEQIGATIQAPAYKIVGSCTFGGVLTPNNTLIVEFGGAVVATGPTSVTVPLLTAVDCEINNFNQGHNNMHHRDFSLNGPASAIADSTLTSGTPEWPVAPITICVSGFAIFGPTPVRILELTKRCETPFGDG